MLSHIDRITSACFSDSIIQPLLYWYEKEFGPETAYRQRILLRGWETVLVEGG